tara:strand:+ start:30215 stop:31273 length:1059 start_codon:yes stop_codon:yes gene_type:complete
MKTLDRYIISSIIKTTIMVFFALFGLRMFISLFGEMHQFGQGNYGLMQGLAFMGLNMPLYMYELFPNIALVGALMSLGLLAQNSELTVMRASGMSMFRIIWSVVMAALIMIVFMTLVGEGLAPHLSTYSEITKAKQKADGQLITTQYGTWMRMGNSFIHVTKNVDNKHLEGVVRYRFNAQHELLSASSAKTADLKDDEWVFHDIATSYFGKNKVTKTTEATEKGKLLLTKEKIGDLQPDELPLTQLYTGIRHRESNGLNADDYELSFWTRLLQPITTLIMVLLAVPFIFGPLRTVTMGLRILSGAMVGLAFYIFNRFFGPFSIVYQLPPFVAAVIPPCIFASIAAILMFKKK